MELRLLRYFLTVTREGSIVKAAAALNITQPTLSRQIMDLERELGAKLLIRSRKQLTLTDTGILFQQRAKEILELSEKVRREVAEQEKCMGGTVSIACVETMASEFLSDVLYAFRQQYPRVKYNIYSADGDGIRDSIDRGQVDLGVLLEPVETAKYDFIRLPIHETWGFAVRKDSLLAQKDSLTISDIRELPLIIPRRPIVVEEISKWLNVEDESLHIAAFYNLPTNGLLFVRKNLGCLVCVKGTCDLRPMEDITFVPFSPQRVTGHVLAWKKQRSFFPITERFLQYVRDAYEN